MQLWEKVSSDRQSLLTRFVLWTGLARNQKQVEYILTGVAGACAVIILWPLISHLVFRSTLDRASEYDVQQNPNYEPTVGR